MQTVYRISELRKQIVAWRRADERIALVPTMGNLHQGHIRLLEQARYLANRTVASIFVNPMQFGPSEDYQNYPRTLEEDSHKLKTAGLDLLFAPNNVEIYPHGLDNNTRVEVPELSEILCGTARPGHFIGVATVVTKLFNMVLPDMALFGEKDWQQLIIIRRMVADLNMPVEIVGVPTIRENDGLAMSSRNQYLSPVERAIAPTLFATLRETAENIKAGERDFHKLESYAIKTLQEAGFRPDYFQVLRAHDLAEPDQNDTDLRVIAAAWLGQARLIDNLGVTTIKAPE